MNIRMNNFEIRFRLAQEEVDGLLSIGSVKEEVTLPSGQLCFQVEFGELTQVIQSGHKVVFQLEPDTREKFKLAPGSKVPIARFFQKINMREVCFSVEVDAFKTKLRGPKI